MLVRGRAAALCGDGRARSHAGPARGVGRGPCALGCAVCADPMCVVLLPSRGPGEHVPHVPAVDAVGNHI